MWYCSHVMLNPEYVGLVDKQTANMHLEEEGHISQ